MIYYNPENSIIDHPFNACGRGRIEIAKTSPINSVLCASRHRLIPAMTQHDSCEPTIFPNLTKKNKNKNGFTFYNVGKPVLTEVHDDENKEDKRNHRVQSHDDES